MRVNRFTQPMRTLRAYCELLYFDMFLARGNFAGIHEKVRTLPVENRVPDASEAQNICRAVDMACVFYWKEVLCLQRSAATTCLLRRRGVPAQLLLGARQMPFKSHAWVEVDGCVMNDRPYMRDIYDVLDCC